MTLFFILVPLFSLVALNLPLRGLMRRIAPAWLLALSAAQVYLAVGYIFDLSVQAPVFGLHIDLFGAVVLFGAGLVLACALLAGEYLIQDKEKLFNFVNLLLVSLSGINGVAMATDIFSLYVFIEITAVASYVLISSQKEKYALEAAFKYIVLSSVATAMMLSSIALILLISGSTDFSAIHAALMTSAQSWMIMLAIGVFLCALFIKGGLMPFHGWLPDVYTFAPAPVSILLAGIVTKTLGVFVLIRLAVSVVDFSWPVRQVVLFIGAFSIVAGALAAIGQKDFKRMLAYSSISQVGYILIGLGCGNILGILGSIFHLLNHSIFKTTLFVNSAALESQTGTRDMQKLGGLVSRMPVTGITSVVASLSAAGIPPLAGFWSKLLIVIALWISGHYGYAVIAVAASVLTLAYLLSMQRQVFLGNPREEFAGVKEAGFGLVFPACVLTAVTIGLGLAFPFCLKLLQF